MFRKLSLPVLAAASLACAAEVTISGSMSADVQTFVDESWKPNNAANQDITLTTRAEFDEKAAVELYITNFSTVTDPQGDSRASVVRSVERGRSAAIDDLSSRWGNMAFDGIQFQWEFARKAKFLVGDLRWSAGATNYFGYSWSQEYGSIMKEQTVRGIGFDLGGDGQVALGMPDGNSKAFWGSAYYTFRFLDRTDEKFSARPIGDLVFKNGGRSYRYNLGCEAQYSKAKGDLAYGFSSAWGMRPFHGENTHSFLIEPSMGYKAFSLAGTFYQAIPANADSAISLQTDMPEEQFVYIEPGVNLHAKFAMGIAGEFHNPSTSVSDDEYFAATPTFYLYPAAEVSFTIWSRYQWMMAAHDVMSFGVAGRVDF